MSDRVVILTCLLAPTVVLGIVALVRGYSIKVWREDRRRHDPDEDHPT